MLGCFWDFNTMHTHAHSDREHTGCGFANCNQPFFPTIDLWPPGWKRILKKNWENTRGYSQNHVRVLLRTAQRLLVRFNGGAVWSADRGRSVRCRTLCERPSSPQVHRSWLRMTLHFKDTAALSSSSSVFRPVLDVFLRNTRDDSSLVHVECNFVSGEQITFTNNQTVALKCINFISVSSCLIITSLMREV